MDTQAPGRRVRLLDDAPADADAFGPHQQIAHTIRSLIEREDGGKAIALVGSWGSGKSTVVNLLKRKCTGQEDPLLFVFDAWAHEGDPLRRTFLEQLIRQLQKADWISVANWKERLDSLAKRKKESTTKSTPRLTILGTISAALLFLVPIGIELISSQRIWWKLTGVVFAVAPVLCVGLAWIMGSIRKRQDRWNVFSHLVSKTEEITKTETLESPDPTSFEFEAWFRDLADDALQKERRLLIVLDNLDRVDSEDARKLWTAMRTFLDFPEASPPEWVARLWTLVPFDPEGITELWGRGDVRDRFIAKTFQVRFKVPPPLLSDWRSFFFELLKIAFPDDPEDDFYTISRIYGTLCATSPLTPRAIKLFINEMAAAYETAAFSVPLSHVALFVAISLADPTWTPTSDLPNAERLQPYLGANWREDLAALFFKMPREKARQVLYGEAVEKALTEGDGEALRKLVEVPGIEFVAEQVLEQRRMTWRDKEAYLLGKASYALSEAHVPSTPIWDNAWSLIIGEVRNAKEWKFLDAATGKGLAALVVRTNKKSFTLGLLGSLNEIPSSDSEQRKDLLTRWGAGLLEILNGVIEAQQEPYLKEFISESGFGKSTEQYLSLMAAVLQLQDRRSVRRFIRPAIKEAQITDALVANVRAAKFVDDSAHACEAMTDVDYDWAWQVLTNAIQDRFNQGQFPPPEAGSALEVLLILRNKNVDAANLALSNIVGSGWLFHCFSQSLQGNHYHTTATCILAALIHQPEANAPHNPGQAMNGRSQYRQTVSNPQQQPKVLEEVLKLATRLKWGRMLLEKRNEVSSARPLIDYILEAMVTGAQTADLFPAAVVIETWPLTRDIFGTHFDELITRLSETANLVERLSQAAFSVKLASLYRIALRKKTTEFFLSAIAEKLRTISKDEWLEGLRTGSDLLGLVEEIQKSHTVIGAGHSLQDALADIVKDMVSGKDTGRLDNASFNVLLDCLSDEQRELLISHIRDEVIEAEKDTSVLLTVYSSALNRCEFLTEKADDLVRRAFKQMLHRRIPTELSWISDVLHKCPDLVKQTKPATKSDFKDRIRELLEESLNEDVARLVHDIATQLKVEKKKE